MSNSKTLYRSETDRMLGGVCGGIAEVYNMDPAIVRIGYILVGLMLGIPIILYLVAWIVIPTESEVKNHKKVKDVEAEKVEENNEDEEQEDELRASALKIQR